MKLFRPMDILGPHAGSSALTASNIEVDFQLLWDSGTSYALDDMVSMPTTEDAFQIYKSLSAGNTNHNPQSEPTWWQYLGDTYRTYSSITTYNTGHVVIFNRHEYEAKTDGIVNKVPDTNPSDWLDRGLANRWKMFDTSITSQTERPDEIIVKIATVGRNDSVALLNIEADSYRIVAEDATDGVIYDSGVVSLLSPSGVANWWDFFFEPVTWLNEVALISATAMPPYANVAVTVTLSRPGGTVKCGALVIGLAKEIGATQYGASFGIDDYSIKERDDFGRYDVVERAFNKYADFSVIVENSKIDELQRFIAQYRATPIVWIGADGYTSTMIYGFFEGFNNDIQFPTASVCSISIKGLT